MSEADLAVDQALLDLLGSERPDDSLLSEESGPREGDRPGDPGVGRRWILDPIDGTDPFLAGQRAWGTHVALEADGELQVVVLTRPTEKRRWWAVRGHGAWSSHEAAPLDTSHDLTVSTVADLADARVGGFVETRSVLADAARRHASWAEDPLGPVVGLIEGRLDVVLGPGGAVWDHAPQVLFTIEAGGRYTDPGGGHQLDAGGGLYTNGLLDEPIRATPGLRQTDWPN